MSAPWRVGASDLKTLRGTIIDRDTAWRADIEMAPVIDAAIRAGIENVDEEAFDRIYMYLRYGPMGEDGRRHSLPGTYETYGLDENQMAKAWRRYLKKHGVQPVPPVKP